MKVFDDPDHNTQSIITRHIQDTLADGFLFTPSECSQGFFIEKDSLIRICREFP
jgi:hypothetical protein